MQSARSWAAVYLTLLVVAGLLPALSTSVANAGEPLPAATTLAADGRMQIHPTDRCPVCAMFPARRPQTAAAMTLKSGATYYFCGNGCLLRGWLRPTIYLGRIREAIDRLVVRDYFSGRPVDARAATWVAGSDVIGPMGPAIVTLADPGQLEIFKKRHGGTIVFTFDQVDDALWRQISRHKLPDETSN